MTAAQLPGESLTGLGTLINALESTINTAVGNIEALGSGTITDSSDVTTIANELVAMVQVCLLSWSLSSCSKLLTQYAM